MEFECKKKVAATKASGASAPSGSSGNVKPPVAPEKEVRQEVSAAKASGQKVKGDTVQSRKMEIPRGSVVKVSEMPAMPDTIAEVQEMPQQGPSSKEARVEESEESKIDLMMGDRHTETIAVPEDEIVPEEEPNLQLYTPSSMLSWGQFEAKFFQQLYTQTHFFDPNGEAVPQNARTTYYSGIFNLVFGYSSRFNFGVDAWLQSVLIDAESSSPFQLFSFQSSPFSRTALTAVGPKIKYQPIPKLNGLTLQSSFLFPIAKDPQGRTNGRPYLATENMLWWTQIFYTHMLANKLQLFTELDAYWSINRGVHPSGSGSFSTPASLFLSYFPTNRITVYGMNQFWGTLGEDVFSSWWYQVGVGAKYRIADGFDLEFMYGRFLAGRAAAGQATALNFGVRFVHW